MTSQCSARAAEFEDRQKIRAEELDAIAKAVEVLQGDSVARGTAAQGFSLIQLSAGKKRLFSSSSSSSEGDDEIDSDSSMSSKLALFLAEKGRDLKSRVLSTLATRVAQDPLAKVKKLIQDLIVKLMEEANEEADHNAWCGTELKTNEKARTLKTSAVEKLRIRIEELEATIAKHGEQVLYYYYRTSGIEL